MKCCASMPPRWRVHVNEVELPTIQWPVRHRNGEHFAVSASYPASRVRTTRIPAGIREVDWTNSLTSRCVTVGCMSVESREFQRRFAPRPGG